MTALATIARSQLAFNADDPEFERNAAHMAQVYEDSILEIEQIGERLAYIIGHMNRTFHPTAEANGVYFSGFSLGLESRGRSERWETIKKDFKATAWSILVERLGIKNLMSLAKRAEFNKQLHNGTLPEITPETITQVIMGLVDQAQDFMKEAAKEVFEFLRPWHWSNARNEYKTNHKFFVGRRVILSYMVEQKWGGAGFRVNYNREQKVTAMDGVFHLLAGRGVMRENRGPLWHAIDTCNGKGETEFFRFKCFKNGNLHLEFKDLELVKELNYQAAGERVLGADCSA